MNFTLTKISLLAKWLGFACLISFPLALIGQEEDRDLWHRIVTESGINSNTQGVFWMIGGGYYNQPLDLEVTTDFHMLIGRRKVRIGITDQRFFQYRERKYLMSLGATKYMALGEIWSAYVNLKGAYVWGDYAGTLIQPGTGFTVLPETGLRVGNGDWRMKMGLAYYPSIVYEQQHWRLAITFQYLIKKYSYRR